MKRWLIALAALLAAPAAAQLRNLDPPFTGTGESPNFSSITPSGNPARRKQRLNDALQLKAEAQRLQAQDGGVLTPEHQDYINRRARKIMSSR